MLILVRPIHRLAKKYQIAHHHILLVLLFMILVISGATLFSVFGLNFSSMAQVGAVFTSGASLAVFFYILLAAEEWRIENEQNRP
ncbi:hypothetical protein [Acidithiobacillus acidisediminis]|uniref:hypothetical protein n=1 Tax=Acidithiobacillus TaxID=119977 RepID=UPI00200D1398|nr:hypothetical protein [Acidithiobacillus sp. S30A2]